MTFMGRKSDIYFVADLYKYPNILSRNIRPNYMSTNCFNIKKVKCALKVSIVASMPF